ncbi:hypothetical protein [Actinoallomurus acaciae]|uniref:hypothetical protein n=1 Tax=Actinoallomurus acaciae TaxID=502577 RepID=UPI003671217E
MLDTFVTPMTSSTFRLTEDLTVSAKAGAGASVAVSAMPPKPTDAIRRALNR